jgi:hypothetical protein
VQYSTDGDGSSGRRGRTMVMTEILAENFVCGKSGHSLKKNVMGRIKLIWTVGQGC